MPAAALLSPESSPCNLY